MGLSAGEGWSMTEWWYCNWPVGRGGAVRLFCNCRWISDHRRPQNLCPNDIISLRVFSCLAPVAHFLHSLHCFFLHVYHESGVWEVFLFMPAIVWWWGVRATGLHVIANEMTLSRLIVALWVMLVVFGSLLSQSQKWRRFPSSNTNAAKSLISIYQQCTVKWNYSEVILVQKEHDGQTTTLTSHV